MSLNDYLQQLRTIRNMGRATDETSYYTPLENLLNAVGARIPMPVVVTSQLSSRGAAITPRAREGRGMPDFGFFVQQTRDLRGLVEAKGADENVRDIANQPQISRYLRLVPAVLITTYREFLFVTRGPNGTVEIGPSYSLAPDAQTFWDTPIPQLLAAHENGFRGYLENILQFSGPIISAEELALVLARYAVDAKQRIDAQQAVALDPLRIAMSEALGISFLGPKGEAFFRSSLVQTLFYGLFSAWTIWSDGAPKAGTRFEWEEASSYLKVSVVGALFEAIATNRRLRTLDLSDPVRWTEDALNRVDRNLFFANFDQQHAIQYFYEPFLEAYDPVLREQLGVWYTPTEIVQYQVRRVDKLLREELNIERGLADESVIVLDPCTGTGSYLLETARLIHERLMEEEPGLAAAQTKRAITTRLFGFEIMPAPFVIVHLQMARLLSALGSGLREGERAAVYLTNALTNWVRRAEPRQALLSFPELTEEREAAERVKQEERILVIIGNPPYWRYTTMAVGEEANLIAPYKENLFRRYKVRKSTIDDLYIRFYRLGEWRVADQEGRRGIVSYISNWSWLAGNSFPVLRERFVNDFNSIFIDSLGGGYRGRDKRIEEADQSVFRTDMSPGISLSVAISFLVADGEPKAPDHQAEVWYRRLLGRAHEKREELLRSLNQEDMRQLYDRLTPSMEKKWVLRPAGQAGTYDSWIGLDRLLPYRESGVNENRRSALISIDRQELEALQAVYMDASRDAAQVANSSPRAAALMSNFARYNAAEVRSELLKPDHPEAPRIVRFAYKPFDDRWLLWGGEKLLNEKRKDLMALVDADNIRPPSRNVFIVTSENARVVYSPPGVTTYMGDLHYQDPWAQLFPLRQHIQAKGFMPSILRPNLDQNILAALAEIRGVATSPITENGTAEEMAIAEEVFYHVLATLHTPSYLTAHEDALSSNWSRIPIPLSPQLLTESARLGRRVAELLRTDMQPAGVVAGNIPTWLRSIARPRRHDNVPLRDPEDFSVTVNYGGNGRVEARALTPEEINTLTEDVDFGEETNDVYWSREACWSNVPAAVWDFDIGGFQVLKKWLESRRSDRLGRPLQLSEIQQFSLIARRIAALVHLGDELDECHDVITTSELLAIN